jgi:hypothetical protein
MLTVRRCVLLATVGTILGLLTRFGTPVPPTDSAFHTRVEWWKTNAESLFRAVHMERYLD